MEGPCQRRLARHERALQQYTFRCSIHADVHRHACHPFVLGHVAFIAESGFVFARTVC